MFGLSGWTVGFGSVAILAVVVLVELLIVPKRWILEVRGLRRVMLVLAWVAGFLITMSHRPFLQRFVILVDHLFSSGVFLAQYARIVTTPVSGDERRLFLTKISRRSESGRPACGA